MTTVPPDRFGPLAPLSPDALSRSMAETLAAAPAADALWLFAYGSLIWSPCFAPAETRPGVLQGYRRAFNLWTIHSRGTREKPGLALGLEPGGLEPGGRCGGVLFRISAETRSQDLQAIWEREMFSGVYRPCWLPVDIEGGARPALCFVTEETHPQYAGAMTPEAAAAVIADAEGVFGACRDYLFDLLRTLESHGIREPDLDALAALVRAHATD